MGCPSCGGCVNCRIAAIDFSKRDVGTDVGDDFTEVIGDWEIADVVPTPGFPAQPMLRVGNPTALLISDYETPATGDWFISAAWRTREPSGQARIIFNYQDSSNYQYVQFQNSSAFDGLFITDGAKITFGAVADGSNFVLLESVMFPYVTGAGRIGVCYDSTTQRLIAGAGWDSNHNLVLIDANPNIYSGSKTGIATGINPPSDYNVFSDFYVGKGSDKCPSCDALCHRCIGDEPYDTLAVTISGLTENPDYASEPCGDCDDFNERHTLRYWGFHPAGSFHGFASPPCVWGKEIFDPVICGYTRLMTMHGPLCFSGCGPGQTPFYRLAWTVSIEQVTPSGVASDQTMQLLLSWECCDSPLTYTGPWTEATGSDPCRFSDEAEVTIEFSPELPDCGTTTTTTEPPPGEWYCNCFEETEFETGVCVQGSENITDFNCGGPYPTQAECEEVAPRTPPTTTTTQPPTTTTTEGPRIMCCLTAPDQAECIELAHDEDCNVISGPYADMVECLADCEPPTTTTTQCQCQPPTNSPACLLQVLGPPGFLVWASVGQPYDCNYDEGSTPCTCWTCDNGEWKTIGDSAQSAVGIVEGVCNCHQPTDPCS
jgi:hypothetical protein